MATPEHLQSYVEALKAHDWEFEFSDDARVVREGRASRNALKETQALVDPHCEVWNAHAPEGYRVHVLQTRAESSARSLVPPFHVTPRDLFFGLAMQEYMRQYHASGPDGWSDADVCGLANNMADAAMKARKA